LAFAWCAMNQRALAGHSVLFKGAFSAVTPSASFLLPVVSDFHRRTGIVSFQHTSPFVPNLSHVCRTSHDEGGVWDVYEHTLESEDVCLFLVVTRRAHYITPDSPLPLHRCPCESVSLPVLLLFWRNTPVVGTNRFLLLQSY
jgi:hypothetical protein